MERKSKIMYYLLRNDLYFVEIEDGKLLTTDNHNQAKIFLDEEEARGFRFALKKMNLAFKVVPKTEELNPVNRYLEKGKEFRSRVIEIVYEDRNMNFQQTSMEFPYTIGCNSSDFHMGLIYAISNYLDTQQSVKSYNINLFNIKWDGSKVNCSHKEDVGMNLSRKDIRKEFKHELPLFNSFGDYN